MNIRHITMRRAGTLAAITMVAALGGGASAQAHDTSESGGGGHLTQAQRTVVREATHQFKDVDAAFAAGYLPTETCSELPGVGGMGYHFMNPVLAADARIDPTQPEVLLYKQDSKGRFRLIGVEWFQADADQNLTTDADRPTLFGHPFDGPMAGHEEGMPVHFDLHAWVYATNPTGELSAWNPNITCPRS